MIRTAITNQRRLSNKKVLVYKDELSACKAHGKSLLRYLYDVYFPYPANDRGHTGIQECHNGETLILRWMQTNSLQGFLVT